jgi:hypothetical protein
MHPADQYEAFKALSDAGQSPEDMPGSAPAQRSFGSASSRLLDIYRTLSA